MDSDKTVSEEGTPCVFCGEPTGLKYFTCCDDCEAYIFENGARPYWWQTESEAGDEYN